MNYKALGNLYTSDSKKNDKILIMKIIYSVILIHFLLVGSIKGETVKMITLDWPPFYSENLPGNGFYAKLIRSVLKRANYDFDLKFAPWVRAIKESKSGDYHALFACWHTKEREKDYYYSRKTLNAGPSFIVLSDNKLKVKSIKDLHGLHIGIIKGYAFSSKLEKAIEKGLVKKSEVYNSKHLFNLLKHKRVDLILENLLVAEKNIKNDFPKEKLDIRVAGSDFMDGHMYMCWSKKKKGVLKIKKTFDKTYSKMLSDGLIEKMLKDFGVKNYKTLLGN